MQKELKRAALRLGQGSKLTLNTILGRLAVLVLKAVRRSDSKRAADFGGRLLRRLGPLLPEHRIGRANIAAAFPEWPAAKIEQTLAGVWENLGRLAAEFAHFDRLGNFDPATQELTDIEFTPGSGERFNQLRDDGKPALLFGAHLANWELTALVSSMFGLETAILFRRPNMPDVERLVREIRASRMGTLIPTQRDAP
jgi:KDO2-lipid IV(A) lauroyltransferase